MGPRQAACSGGWGSMPGGCTALLQLLLLAALAAALAAPTVAAESINSMACPTGANIINVNAANPGESDLYSVFSIENNGPGKTYVLAPGSYVMSGQIKLDARDSGVTASTTTCFIGGGARKDVVVTATGVLSRTPAFAWYSYAPKPAIGLGLKGLILDNAGNAAGVEITGDNTAWSIEDVTIRNGTGGLESSDAISTTELANATFEGLRGTQAINFYRSPGPPVVKWSDLTVTDCATVQSAVAITVDLTIGGRVFLARNRALSAGGALAVNFAQVDFTGDVIIEGNEATTNQRSISHGGAGAYFYGASIRFTGTLAVQNNIARQPWDNGGGFVLDDSTVTILGSSTFITNSAGGVGGAVYLRRASHMDLGGGVCIQQNVAAGDAGSGIYLADGSTVTFTSPADAQMGDNVPAGSSIFVDAGASWTCSGSGVTRGAGVYELQGAVCACTNTAGGSCPCPITSPIWYPAACACRECEPGSGPCCSDTAQLVPCIRSLVFVPDNIISHACDGVELLVIVTGTTPTTDPSTPNAQAKAVPAVDVPVVFSVSGDCGPSLQARTVRTDAQGRARVRVTSQGPGVAAVTAAVASGATLPQKVVLATSHIKFLPCHKTDRKHTYDAPDGDNKDE